jgi:hypothetical protein
MRANCFGVFRSSPEKAKLAAAWMLSLIVGILSTGSSSGVEVITNDDLKQSETEKSRWAGDAGFNLVNAYYAYGILQEDRGLIIQPFTDLSYSFFESDGFLSKASIGLQLWASIHSRKTDATTTTKWLAHWYEQDVDIPVSLTFSETWNVTLSYLEYRFPNGALDTERSFSANISYDDTKALGAFALHPHIIILYNFEGEVGIAQSDAWYFEVGIAPGTVFQKKSSHPMTLTFPVTVGVGDDHFYPGDRFGYASFGASLSFPIATSPTAGSWSVNFGLACQIFGNSTAQTNGERRSVVGQTGIKWEF